jgi:hypothetical protein
MKILCHVGPWSKDYLAHICKGIDPDSTVLLSTTHQKVDDSQISRRYYDFLTINANKKYQLTVHDNDMIVRCRLLKTLSQDEALLHLNSMRDAIIEMFDQFQPELVISETIDAYIMDIFYDESRKRGIQFIGLVASFVNGYFRISARGEYHNLRQPDEQEVQKVLNMLEEKKYTPAFVGASRKKHTYEVLKRWSRNCVKPLYFPLKRVLSGEKYSYHYWATQIVATEWFHLFPKLTLGETHWQEKLAAVDKPVIYVPLQMVPEATVDYWCECLDSIDYDGTLLSFIERFSNDFHFLIKEHPNVLGFRNPALYKKLDQNDNVTICPTTTHSNDIVDTFDSVLVWTGTVGFETALRGKPVLSFCQAYYMTGHLFKLIDATTTAAQINQFIADSSRGIDEHQKKELIRYVLSGLLPGQLKFDGSWSADNEHHYSSAIALGKTLRNEVLD